MSPPDDSVSTNVEITSRTSLWVTYLPESMHKLSTFMPFYKIFTTEN